MQEWGRCLGEWQRKNGGTQRGPENRLKNGRVQSRFLPTHIPACAGGCAQSCQRRHGRDFSRELLLFSGLAGNCHRRGTPNHFIVFLVLPVVPECWSCLQIRTLEEILRAQTKQGCAVHAVCRVCLSKVQPRRNTCPDQPLEFPGKQK